MTEDPKHEWGDLSRDGCSEITTLTGLKPSVAAAFRVY